MGRSLEALRPTRDFCVNTDGCKRPAIDVLRLGELYKPNAADLGAGTASKPAI
jgi:hypothetical protein